MRTLFLRMVIAWMQYDLVLEKARLAHTKHCIAADEAQLEYWRRELMMLEVVR